VRILLLAHAFNSLTQRLYVELREDGHKIAVELDVNDATTEQAVGLWRPDLVLAPYLRRAIPEAVWRAIPSLVVHPGPPGDRGPSALDRAILEERREWGVTVLQAEAEMDSGPVWSWEPFALRPASKSSLYRNEVSDAAVRAVRHALAAFPGGAGARVPGPFRPAVRQDERAVDWQRDTTAAVLRTLRAADGSPGVRDVLDGRTVYLYDGHAAPGLGGRPGALVARCGPAVARATADGAVWIGQLRPAGGPDRFKLPATRVLPAATVAPLPESQGYAEVSFAVRDGVGLLRFPFYNGAMGTEQCESLRAAFAAAAAGPAQVLLLLGGPDFFSNGLHLNLIEAAASPADESWRNINAMDDLAREIITATDRLVIAALQGNAGAGGCFLALAADLVWARRGVVLNPHYKGMGNLFGSEYWTYLLPRRAGEGRAVEIAAARLPMGAAEACRLGLVDEAFGDAAETFAAEALARAQAMAASPGLAERLAAKRARRAADEAARPLDDYRNEELRQMRLNFYGFDTSYHVARSDFVRKVPKARTPLVIAPHRRKPHR